MVEKITKTELAAKLGISRPTLDKYLRDGFPDKVKDKFFYDDPCEDIEYKKLKVENEIRLVRYQLKKLEDYLEKLS